MDSQSPDYRGLWVLVDAEGDRLSDAGARLLGIARGLADQAGAPVTALLAGAPPDPDAPGADLGALAIAYGADAVLQVRAPQLAAYDAAAYAAALGTLAAARHPAVILLADGPVARDLAPRLAWRLGTGLIGGADPASLELEPASGTLLATRREWDRRLAVTYTAPVARPQVVTVRAEAALAPYADDWRYGDTETADLADVAWPDLAPATVALHVADTPAPQAAPAPSEEPPAVVTARALRAARCVVVAGRGVGGPEGLARVQALAAALGGEWGATHGAVEAGWAPPEREIGLYGTTVRPDLYVGCGVSGSPTHVVGMQQARTIVAVNTDPEAPIFRWAHYAVVADSTALLDALLERLQG